MCPLLLGKIILREQVQGDLAGRRQILRRIPLAGSGMILRKGNIKYLVQLILNVPMLARGL
ncbi:hypothetical protein [Marinobacterium rhizophilum]|uniref:hypothetical protein n=1 Tax=Marinobacterium rhizophilum TaxID=420402 RepID=UPI0003795400|nr:hypothetical protein [Marinobacterium rhizophilum]